MCVHMIPVDTVGRQLKAVKPQALLLPFWCCVFPALLSTLTPFFKQTHAHTHTQSHILSSKPIHTYSTLPKGTREREKERERRRESKREVEYFWSKHIPALHRAVSMPWLFSLFTLLCQLAIFRQWTPLAAPYITRHIMTNQYRELKIDTSSS